MNKELKGIVIDPSHGGKDSGSVAEGLTEKDLTLKASQYMYDRFKELGIPVILTRENDATVSPIERIEIIKNDLGDQNGVLVITNATNTGGEEGADVIYSVRENDPTLANTILEQIANEGQIPRGAYVRTLPGDNTQDSSYIFRELENAKPLLVEYGFLDNENDREKLKEELLNYVEGVVRGVSIYYGIPYIEPTNLVLDSYVVKKGDSLYSIAQKFNTTIGALRSVNNLSSNIIREGQVIKLPQYVNLTVTPDDIVIYKVSKGDSIYNIAQKYGIEAEDIINYNQLGNTLLSVNQQLLIPLNTTKEVSTTPDINYIVKPGDSLYSIAKKYNVSPTELKAYNNLKSNLLTIGQEIAIPNTELYINYFVRTGDTLEKIAQRFNTTVERIKKINNLNTNDILIGQLLIIG